MPVTINAIAGDPAANSFVSSADADAYFATRIPLKPVWIPGGSDVTNTALIMATRVLSAMNDPHKKLYVRGDVKFYRVSQAWTGAIATLTQGLPWPRSGMFNRLGIPIDPTLIPQELKDATSEFAGQLRMTDRTLDAAPMIQGLTNVNASGISISFKADIDPWVVPGAVINLMPASWLTDELWEPAQLAEIDMVDVSYHRHHRVWGW